MTAITFAAMGTSWWIDCDQPHLLGEAEALVHTLEGRLSRFRGDSALTRLNRDRSATCPTLAAVTRVALRLRTATGWAFDPTLGAELAALGYDRSFEQLGHRTWSSPLQARRSTTRVLVDGAYVRLDGPGQLDLGGLAKGYAVDRVVGLLLGLGAGAVLVDGGGDIRGAGPSFAIGVGDGLVVETRAGAVATSSTRSRRWHDADGRELHHILDPRTGLPTRASIDTATVIAPDAVTADALATALLADPAATLTRLGAFAAHALVRAHDGGWWMSPGAPAAPGPTSLLSASAAPVQEPTP